MCLPFLRAGVLLFARSSDAAAQAKPMGTRSFRLHRAMLVSVLRSIDQLHESIELVLPEDQANGLEALASEVLTTPRRIRRVAVTGDGFGARFSGAVDRCLEFGVEQLVVVGGDVPEIRPRHFIRAFALLSAGYKAAVGPSPDGGFYLLATRAPVSRKLARVTWRGASTADEVMSALSLRGVAPACLEPLADLDGLHDLWQLRVRLQRLHRRDELSAAVSSALMATSSDEDGLDSKGDREDRPPRFRAPPAV